MARTRLASLLLPLLVVGGVPPGAGALPGDADPVGSWPLRPEPEVVHGFDPPGSPWGAGHRGVDLAGRPGQVVRSALAGTVTHASPLAGRGVVVVSHGATRTTYEPVEAGVSVGQPVVGGQRLGTLQAAPSHCSPATCLHWGWLEGGTYLDPLRLVGGGPVRLLPLWSDLPVGDVGDRRTAPGGIGAAVPALEAWVPPEPAYAGVVARPLPVPW